MTSFHQNVMRYKENYKSRGMWGSHSYYEVLTMGSDALILSITLEKDFQLHWQSKAELKGNEHPKIVENAL